MGRQKYDPVRSIRVGDQVWLKAKRRATYEGVTMSDVVNRLVQGYAEGKIALPTVQVVFTPPTEDAS